MQTIVPLLTDSVNAVFQLNYTLDVIDNLAEIIT